MASDYAPGFYDAIFPALLGGDIERYCEVAGQCSPTALELGAGTGRTVIPVARQGIGIDALEFDEPMRWRLKQRLAEEARDGRQRVQVMAGDMRDFAVPRRYALIQIPFRAFLHNLTRDD